MIENDFRRIEEKGAMIYSLLRWLIQADVSVGKANVNRRYIFNGVVKMHKVYFYIRNNLISE